MTAKISNLNLNALLTMMTSGMSRHIAAGRGLSGMSPRDPIHVVSHQHTVHHILCMFCPPNRLYPYIRCINHFLGCFIIVVRLVIHRCDILRCVL
jgi:hypothetical protein